MKTFVVLSCLVAVVCGLNRYPYGGGGSFGASKYGYESQQQQSAHHESHQSSSQVASSGGITSAAGGLIGGGGLGGGLGGIGDSYGLASGGAYDASSIAANTLASRSSFAGAETALAGGAYGADYGVGGIQDAALAAGGVGLGGSSLGGFNSYNAGGQSFSRQSSMSRSSSFSSSSSQHSLQYYQSEWPELYQVPLFQSLCGLKSTLKSQELYSTIGQQYRANQFDFGSTFADLYSKNTLLQKYFYTATGIRYQDSYRSNYVQLINQQPMHALRLATIFARNPNIFTSPFGQFIIGGSSLELLQGYQTSSTRYSYDAFSSSRFLSSLVRSRYYSRTLASVFGIQSNLSYELLQQQLINRIGGYYRSNAAGTLLLLRHVLARRQITSLEPYLGCTGADIYSSQLDNYWGQKAWRHNSYYSSWSRQFARSSSFSSSSSRSSRVMSRSLSANNLGYSGIGI